MKAREIPVPLPHPALAGAAWTGALMAVRNLAVRPFGLKGDAHAAAPGARRIGMFPIVAHAEGEIVLGFDDRHLDFRIVVETEPSGDGATVVRLLTLVRRHNALGRTYLAAIMPFHKLIVVRSLSRVR